MKQTFKLLLLSACVAGYASAQELLSGPKPKTKTSTSTAAIVTIDVIEKPGDWLKSDSVGLKYAQSPTYSRHSPTPLVKLPRPNSVTFSQAEAEARRGDILDLTPSGKRTDWVCPNFGFNLHITAADEIIIYNQRSLPSKPEEAKVTLEQLKELLSQWPQAGEPLGVLITSERDPKQSKSFAKAVDLLFQPRVQIYYAKTSVQISP